MASIFDAPPPPVYTRDGRDGFPPEAEFENIMAEYVDGLNPRKRDKALMTQAMYDAILHILTSPPTESRGATAQFRFWTKKMFRLVTTAHAQIVTHENRPVAVREQIYDVLVQCHQQCSHGGRDKTSNQVRRYYSWIPKELIARFVKACPLCNARKTAKAGGGTAGLVALGVLGADLGALYANSMAASECSSPPSESVNGSSGLSTPSKQSSSRPSTASQHQAPLHWPPYLVQAGYPIAQPSTSYPGFAQPDYSFQYAMPPLPTVAGGLPPMPSPVKGPHDWSQWLHSTPQRPEPSHQFSGGSASRQLDQHEDRHSTVDQTEELSQRTPTIPQGISTYETSGTTEDTDVNCHGRKRSVHSEIFDETLRRASADYATVFQESQEPETAQAQVQDPQSYLSAPVMAYRGSTDSMTSLTSASTHSSSDVDHETALSPTPEGAAFSSAASAQNPASKGTGPLCRESKSAHSFDDEERSFQNFMSSFATAPIDQEQIDPLLRAMKLEHLAGIPLNDNVSPFNYKLPSPTAGLPSNTLKTDTSAELPSATSLDAVDVYAPQAESTPAPPNSTQRGPEAYSESLDEADPPLTLPHKDTPRMLGEALHSYKELSSVFNNIWQGNDSTQNGSQDDSATVPNCDDPAAYDANTSVMNNDCNANFMQDHMNQPSTATEFYGEFSFNIYDTSATLQDSSFSTGGPDNSAFTTVSTTDMGTAVDGRQRPRPPGLDLASFSNNNAFSQVEAAPHSAYDWQTSYNNSFLSPCGMNATSHAMTGSMSAPPQMITFANANVSSVGINNLLDPSVFSAGTDQGYPDLSVYNTSFGNGTYASGSLITATSGHSEYQTGYPSYGDIGYLQQPVMNIQRPASAAGYLEHGGSQGSNQLGVGGSKQNSLAPAIHSAPFFHLPMSAQQHQAQARELSEQIQAILDSAVPNPEALAARQASFQTPGSAQK